MTLKESALTLTPTHWIALFAPFAMVVGWAIYVEVQLAEIRNSNANFKELQTNYVQQNYNDHRGMYVDFKGEIQTINSNIDGVRKDVSELKDLIISTSRGGKSTGAKY